MAEPYLVPIPPADPAPVVLTGRPEIPADIATNPGLRALKERFGADHDCFSDQERERLTFLRFLVQEKGLEP